MSSIFFIRCSWLSYSLSWHSFETYCQKSKLFYHYRTFLLPYLNKIYNFFLNSARDERFCSMRACTLEILQRAYYENCTDSWKVLWVCDGIWRDIAATQLCPEIYPVRYKEKRRPILDCVYMHIGPWSSFICTKCDEFFQRLICIVAKRPYHPTCCGPEIPSVTTDHFTVCSKRI